MAANKKKSQDKEKGLSIYGSWAFIIGIIIILLGALFNMTGTAEKVFLGVLIALGLVVGAINITRDEVTTYLLASLVFVLLGQPFLGLISRFFTSGAVLTNIITYLIAFIVPGAVVVSLITILRDAKGR